MSTRPRRWLGRLVLAALLPITGADAHEIGTTQVRLTLHRDHTWSAAITTAPQALVNRLEARAKQPRSIGLDVDALRAKLKEFAETIAQNVDVRFDGAPASASVTIARLELPADLTLPAFVVLRANGSVPKHALDATWRYDLVYSTYSVVFTDEDGGGILAQWLDGDATSRPFPIAANVKPPTSVEIFVRYLSLGFRHIVPEGLDHILFVLGIFLLSTKLSSILVQVTAFTVAHSVTLGLTMYGVVSLPSRIVEPLIALSVVYVAVENIMTSKLTPWRPAVVFGFGLLHGMGFAGALTEMQLPRSEIVPSLIGFNLGIELAQLTIIGVAFFAVAAWCQDESWYRARVVVPVSVAIAAIGLIWTVQRIAEL